MTSIRYQVGGALPQDVSSYVTRDSDRQLLEAMKAGEFCYVLNSRQMGKSSLMVRTLAQLQESGWKGITLDFSAKDTQSDRPDSWYFGIINELNKKFHLLESKDCIKWFKERDIISPVERLGEFIETVLLPGIVEPIVIFVDEIDSTLGLPFTDDFFALIRACYNKRAEKSDYKRLTFALLGVAAPSELIGDTKRTPFNIGKGIDLSGFTLAEAQPLAAGLAEKSENPHAVLEAILYWTGGQPFLSQRLCQLVADSSIRLVAGHEDSMIEELVRSRLIENWESQDQQSHLKTIRDRVIKNEQKAGYLLELYRQTRQAGSLPVQNRPEEQELQLSGLVVKREGNLQVYNPIYGEVFNELWIDGELAKLRPYSDSFRAWVISGKTDKSRLLRGDALEEAEQWAKEKNPSAEDQDFLSASRIQEREEEFAIKEKEAELERERQDKEAAENARKIEAKAKEIAEKDLAKAGRKIRRGSFILGVALAIAALLGVFAIDSGNKIRLADSRVKESEQKVQEFEQKVQKSQALVDKARQNLENTNAQKEQVEQKLIQSRKDTEKKRKELVSATQDLGKLQNSLKSVKANSKDAEIRLRQAQELVVHARENLANAEKRESQMQQSLVQLERNVSLANQKKSEAERLTMQAQAIQKKAESALKIADIKRKESENERLKAQSELNKANQSLAAVRSLSQLAGKLRKNGAVEESDEALRKAGLSTLIDNEEIKKSWLFAATAEAYISSNSRSVSASSDELKNAKDAIFESLGAIENSKAQSNQGIFNQVKAFAYLIASQLNEDNKEDYQMAYKALKASQLNLYDDKTDTDMLTEKDVENIHYQLIKADRVDINSSNEVAKSFRNHLYHGLEFLLKNDRLKDADLKTIDIMLYISGRYEDGFFNEESLTNFSCDALREIDDRWYNYPKSPYKFGFRKQKEIWQRNGSPKFDSPNEMWNKFFIDVGWKTVKGDGLYGWWKYEDLFSLIEDNSSNAKEGNLPYFQGDVDNRFKFLSSRAVNCNL
jgi:hypothetical protein